MPKTKGGIEAPKSKKFNHAKDIIEREVMKDLDEEAKSILDKVEKMLAEKKKRRDIEKMLVAEISVHCKENMERFFVFVT